MALDKDFLVDIAPEFTEESEARILRFIGLAALSVNRTVFAEKADLATVLLCAHYLTLSGRAGAGGAVELQKVGDLSVKYGTSPTDTELDQTSYGKWLKGLRKQVIITPIVV